MKAIIPKSKNAFFKNELCIFNKKRRDCNHFSLVFLFMPSYKALCPYTMILDSDVPEQLSSLHR